MFILVFNSCLLLGFSKIEEKAEQEKTRLQAALDKVEKGEKYLWGLLIIR